jgi:hypothetical protein
MSCVATRRALRAVIFLKYHFKSSRVLRAHAAFFFSITLNHVVRCGGDALDSIIVQQTHAFEFPNTSL